MLQGCVEHEVCGGDKMEWSTCFFWKAHDAGSVRALGWARVGWLRRETAGERAWRCTQESCRCARGGVCCCSASKNRASDPLLEVEIAEARSPRDALVTEVIGLAEYAIPVGHHYPPITTTSPGHQHTESRTPLPLETRTLLTRWPWRDGCRSANKSSCCRLLLTFLATTVIFFAI